MNREKIAAATRTVGGGLADIFANALDRSVGFIGRNGQFVLALAATILFYLPSLRNGSTEAGFLYSGDVIGYHWPSMLKTHSLISSFQFTGIDFSQFNGSADWFISPNLFGPHPLFVVYSMLTSTASTSMQDIGQVLVLIMALHSFAACYYGLRLLTRFFAFGPYIAAFSGVAFAFSVFMANALGQPMFVICASIVPWAAYAALAFEERPGFARLLYGAIPVLVAYLAGYMPLAAACLGFSLVLVSARLILLGDASLAFRDRARRFAVALAPYVLATVIVVPYMYSIYSFYGESPAARAPSLFFSAHQMADFPQSVMRILSSHYKVPGPMFEFSVYWGLVPIVIAAVFLLSPSTSESLSPWEWRVLKISAAIYFAIVLCTFGEFSAMSDLVYYLVPQVGNMHIYQRFLLPGQFLLAVTIALMLKGVVHVRPKVPLRFALGTLVFATLAVAYVVARMPQSAEEIGLNNYIVFELGLAALAVLALTIPGDVFAYVAVIFLSSLPALDRMYDTSGSGKLLQQQTERNPLVLNDKARAGLVSYLKRFGDKAIIKYVDVTPMWTEGLEVFPKSFPLIAPRELHLSSYAGFSFYLSARADYMRRMPIQGDVQVAPDWEWLLATGADFIVARESDLKEGGALAARLSEARAEDIYRLQRGVVIVPLRKIAGDASTPVFDNGYFRVAPGEATDTRKLENIALNKTASQSSTVLGAEARRAVDGTTDGAFDASSVTHTSNQLHAWWQVDLGQAETIDSVRVWNRTDGASFRLRDFWVFVSDTPFSDKDTVATLRARPGTWGQIGATPQPKMTMQTRGVRGRYVRVQLGGAQPIGEAILSLAEVEVFRSNAPAPEAVAQTGAATVKLLDFTTNHANYLRLDVESAVSSTAAYLLWKNPRLSFYLNGERAELVDRDGLQTMALRPGRNTIEVRYRHWLLTVFWLAYAVFGAACVGAGAVALLQAGRQRQRAAAVDV